VAEQRERVELDLPGRPVRAGLPARRWCANSLSLHAGDSSKAAADSCLHGFRWSCRGVRVPAIWRRMPSTFSTWSDRHAGPQRAYNRQKPGHPLEVRPLRSTISVPFPLDAIDVERRPTYPGEIALAGWVVPSRAAVDHPDQSRPAGA